MEQAAAIQQMMPQGVNWKYVIGFLVVGISIIIIVLASLGYFGVRSPGTPKTVQLQTRSQLAVLSENLDNPAIKGSTTSSFAKAAVAAPLSSQPSRSGPLKQGFQDMAAPVTADTPLTADEDALVNYAPLTILQPGFLGPAIDGVYDEVKGTTMALDRGARCFVIPIDYHEMPNFDPKLFAPRGAPCMLYRDAAGVLRSINSGSIQKVAETLANYGFSNATNFRNDPMIVILYFLRTPDKDSDPAKYLQFLSLVAKALNPLIPYHLGQTPEGAFNRQARADEILYMPAQQFAKKVLIFSNADTKLFRTTDSLKLPRYPVKEDLDYLVHLQIFKDSTIPMGITQMANDKQLARGIIETTGYYATIPPDRMKQTTDKTKIQFTIGLPEVDKIPAVEEATMLLNTVGLQCLPLNLGLLDEKNRDILGLWKQNWRTKPKLLRFIRPKPIVPQIPSPKLDANKGQVTIPKI